MLRRYELIRITALLSLVQSAAGFAPPHALIATRIEKNWIVQSTSLPVTTKTTEQPVETDSTDSSVKLGAWIPLGSASCLDGLTPTQIQVCGLDLVVWQNKEGKDRKNASVGTFSAFIDACPHRLAPLSQGRVDPTTGCLGKILCSFHGAIFS